MTGTIEQGGTLAAQAMLQATGIIGIAPADDPDASLGPTFQGQGQGSAPLQQLQYPFPGDLGFREVCQNPIGIILDQLSWIDASFLEPLCHLIVLPRGKGFGVGWLRPIFAKAAT